MAKAECCFGLQVGSKHTPPMEGWEAWSGGRAWRLAPASICLQQFCLEAAWLPDDLDMSYFIMYDKRKVQEGIFQNAGEIKKENKHYLNGKAREVCALWHRR